MEPNEGLSFSCGQNSVIREDECCGVVKELMAIPENTNAKQAIPVVCPVVAV